MPTKNDSSVATRLRPNDSTQQFPTSEPARPPVTDVVRVGEHLAHTFGAAQALIDRIPGDLDATIEELRRWYYHQHPAERDRLLWQRFTTAAQLYGRLEEAIRVARETLDAERLALVHVEAERTALAAHPLPATVEEAATDTRADAVGRYQSLVDECRQRQGAIAELERLLPPPEQILSPLTEATARLLEAVVTVNREAFVRRVRESGELEHLRARFERLRTMANNHEAEIENWGQRAGRQLHVPRVAFPWPPASVWDALLDSAPEAPELVCNDDHRAAGASAAGAPRGTPREAS